MAQFAIDEILTTGIQISGFVFDRSYSLGTAGQVLTSTSSGVMWQADSSIIDLSALSGQIVSTGALLNNRINSLSGYVNGTFVSGSGVANYVARWSNTKELLTGSIYDLGTGVGIGTTSPAAKLEVKGADNAVITAIFQSFAGNPAYNGGIQLGNAVANQNSQIYHSSAGDNTLTFVSNYAGGTANKFIFAPGGTETVRFQQNGRVGIGFQTPTETLDVSGRVRAIGEVFTLNAATLTDSQTSIALSRLGAITDQKYWEILSYNAAANGDFVIRTINDAYSNAAEGMRIVRGSSYNIASVLFPNGKVGIGTASPTTLLSVGPLGSTTAASGLTFGGDAQANLYRSAEDTIKTDGSLVVAANATFAGSVGIGLTNPAVKLDVSGGNARFSDYIIIGEDLAYPSNTGSAYLGYSTSPASSPQSNLELIDALSNAIGVNDPLRFRATISGQYFSGNNWYVDPAPLSYGTLLNGNASSYLDLVTSSEYSVGISGKRFVVDQGTTYTRPNFILLNTDWNQNFWGFKLNVENSNDLINWTNCITEQAFSTNNTKGTIALSIANSIQAGGISRYFRFSFVANQAITAGSLRVNKIRSLGNQNYSSTIPVSTSVAGNLIASVGIISPTITSLSGNLAATGSTLDTKINTLSGYSNSTFATITNLAATGSTLNARINSLSGYAGSTFLSGQGVANWTARWNGTKELITGSIYDLGTGVGIGTTNPVTLLTVGSTTTTTSSMTLQGEYQSSTFNNTNIFNFRHGGFDRWRLLTTQNSAASNDFDFSINAINAAANGYNTFLTIKGLNGNVGIGTNVTPLKLNVSGSIYMAAGSGSAISWANDISSQFLKYDSVTDGMVLSSWNHTTFLTQQTERVRITSNGNVGIGITVPTSKLNVVETTPTGTRIQLGTASASALMNSDSTNDLLILNAPYGSNPAGASNIGAKWGIKFIGSTDALSNSLGKTSAIYAVSEDTLGYNRGTSLAFYTNQLNDQPYAERMRIYHNGNIGIGITNPSNKLHISGGGISFTTSTGLAVPMIGLTAVNVAYIGPYTTSTDGNAPTLVVFNQGSSVQQTYFYSSGRIAMVLNKEGRLNIAGNAGNTPPALLNVGPASSVDAVSGMSFGNDSSANLYRSAASTIKTDGSLVVVGAATLGPININGGTLGASPVNIALTGFTYAVNNGNVSQITFVEKRFATGGDWTTATTRIQKRVDVTDQAYIEFNPSGALYGMALGVAAGGSFEAMRILSNGRIGIGTTNPTAKLSLNKGSKDQFLALDIANNDQKYALYVDQDNNGSNSFSVWDATNSHTAIRYLPSSAGYWQLYTNDIERVRIDNAGNVGVGTTSMVGKLDVYANTDGPLLSFVRNASAGSSAYSAFVLRRDGNNNGIVLFTNSSTRSTDGGTGNSTIRTDYGNLNFGAGGSQHILTTAGNVGINTTTPQYRLDVNSSIVSRSTLSSPRFSSAGTYVYGVTNSPIWNQGCGSCANNNTTAPDGTTSAGTYTLNSTCASYDLYQTIAGLTVGRVYTVGMWVKLGTATNFCVVVNNSIAWNTIGGKAFTSSDGLSSGKWTHISYTFSLPAGSNQINLHIGYHGESAVTQQTAGTVFLWNIEMTEFSSTWIGNVEDEIRLPGSSIWTSRGSVGIGQTNPLSKFVVSGGTVNTTTYTTSEARIADGSLHLMKTVAGGIFESIRAMNMDTTAGTTVRVLAASTSDPFNNGNGGKVFIDAIRTATNMDLAFSLNDVAGAAAVERVRFMGNGNVGIGITNPACKLDVAGTIRSSTNEIYGFGASDNVSLRAASTVNVLGIYTSNVERLRLAANGYFGVGTDNPSTLLSIGRAGSTAATSGITFGADSQANLYRISSARIKTDGNFTIDGQGGGATSLVLNRSSTSSENGMAFNTAGSVDWYFFINDGGTDLQIQRSSEIDSAPRVRFNGSNKDILFNLGGGNIGVGTSIPTGKVHIVSSIVGETVLRADGTNGTLFSVVDDLSDSLMSVNNSAGLPVLEVFADDRVVAGQYGSGDFVIKNNKVGIGNTNPSYKLDVNGSLGINASTSDTNWPFVVSDNSSAGSRYGLNKVGSMGFNHADGYAQLQLLGTNGAYLDLTNSVGGDSNARLIYYAGNRLDLTYGFISKGTISLNSNGVGIGTTNPAWALDVSGTAIRSFASGSIEPGFIVDYASSNGYGGFFLHTNGVRKWRIGNVGDTDANNPALFIWQEGIGARMYFRTNGNVGVGTTSPDNKLSIGVASDSALGSTSDGLKITDGTRNVQLLRNGTGYNYAGVVGSGSMLYSYDRMHIVADTSNPILFHTNGAERVRIGPDGNVGIGTTAPTNKLQVVGQIAIKGDESADNAKMYFQASDNSNRYTVETDLDGNTNNDLLIFRSNTVDNMLVLKGNGNVGIGTTNPAHKLEVFNTANSQTYVRVNNQDTGGSAYAGLDLQSYGGGWQVRVPASTTFVNPLIFSFNEAERARITSAGNVGIGLTVPTDKIQISGGGISLTTSTGLAVPMLGMTPLNIAYVGPYNTPTDGNAPSTVLFNHGASVQQTWFYSSGSIAMVLNRQGRLHIGNLNNAPNCLLSVGPSSSTTAVSGMCFGNDAQANLYRSAEDTIKTDGNLSVAGTLTVGGAVSLNGHIYGNKSVTLSTASWTTVLTVNMLAHNSCYVKIGAFGDWSNHSAIAFVSELFIQNGNNSGYGEPGTIITAHDNTAGAAGDKIDIQIVDPAAAGTQNFLIQLKLISATSSTNSSIITYHVMGQQASVT